MTRQIVTLFVPDGYVDADEFLRDCQFERARDPDRASTDENRTDPAREALSKVRSLDWASDPSLSSLRAEVDAALAAPHPADDQDLVNMLWTWFEERGHDLREERTYGITSDEFRIMLDEHEANLLPDGHTPPQPAAPSATTSDFERAFTDACDEIGCPHDNEALLQAIADLKKPAAPLGGREAIVDELAQDMLGHAFCADWHDDADKGVREVGRIKALFVERLNGFADAIPQEHRPISDERAFNLAQRIHLRKFSVEDAACEIMIYATDAIEQERGVDRAAIIEECAKVADEAKQAAHIHHGVEASIGADIAARRIRAIAGKETDQ